MTDRWVVYADTDYGPVVKGEFSEREHAEIIADRLRGLYAPLRTWVSPKYW